MIACHYTPNICHTNAKEDNTLFDIQSSQPDDHISEAVTAGKCACGLLIAIICMLVYANTWNAAWHMDDFPNIVNNPLLHIREISIPSLLRATNLFRDQNALYSGIQYRPVSFLTFAINWYFGGAQVLGYHLVNIGIHILCAITLYLFLRMLFQSPGLTGRFQGMENDIALLSAVLWAIHPIQTQAVTYIVQRMCLLATLFYVMGMGCYVRARMDGKRWRRVILYSGCGLCLLLGIGAKENAVMLPLSLGLIEIIFFQSFSLQRHWKKCLSAIGLAAAFTLVMALIFAHIIKLNPVTFIQQLAATRSFTVTQRLLTEPRIVVGYIGQIFFPLLHSFSIEHPIVVSTSLVHPITTLLSLMLIAGLVLTALYRLRTSPILSFAILFYVINQLMESSIIPLELVFEHRNYLPSLFIFFPVAAGVVRILRYYRQNRRLAMAWTVAALTVCFMMVLGATTYFRNQAWESEKTLWDDTLLKNPESARAYAGLAYYYGGIGQYDAALWINKVSLSKQWARRTFPSITLYNMAQLYIYKHDYDKALSLYDQSFATDPSYSMALYGKAGLLADLGRWREAEKLAQALVSRKVVPWDDLNLMGYILLKLQQPETALTYLRRADRISPQNPKIYTNIGAAMTLLKQYRRADWFLIQANRMDPENIVPLLCLMANHIQAHNKAYLSVDTDTLFKWFTPDAIQKGLQSLSENKLPVAVSAETMSDVIAEKLTEQRSAQLRLWKDHSTSR